jgi:hypothetical protein
MHMQAIAVGKMMDTVPAQVKTQKAKKATKKKAVAEKKPIRKKIKDTSTDKQIVARRSLNSSMSSSASARSAPVVATSRHEELLAKKPRMPLKRNTVRKGSTKKGLKDAGGLHKKAAPLKRKKKKKKIRKPAVLSSPLLQHGIGNAAAAATCGG